MIAVREPGAVYLQQTGHDDFTLGEWRRFFAGRPVVVLPAAAAGRVACSAEGCVLPGRGAGAVLLWHAYAPPANCRGIGVIIATGYLDPPQGPGCAGVAVVDRDRVQNGQAIAIRLDPRGPAVIADRDARGAWPWLPPIDPLPQ
jgi:hypothetical protein